MYFKRTEKLMVTRVQNYDPQEMWYIKHKLLLLFKRGENLQHC